MKNWNFIIACFLVITVVSCDNEVDLNDEYVESTVVFGLLDASADTQFVRINKTFLQDGTNAISLASDPSNFNYSNLDVKLIKMSDSSVYQLDTILKPKEAGVFSSEKNIVYYTDTAIYPDESYHLVVTRDDGTIVKAKTRTLEGLTVKRPSSASRVLSVASQRLEMENYKFEVNYTYRAARIFVTLEFKYFETINGITSPKSVLINVGEFVNSALSNGVAEINFPGQRFYKTIADSVPPTPYRKAVAINNNLIIRVYAVDDDYQFFSQINGPLEGLLQVKPEYTNIENGLGIYASRSLAEYSGKLESNSRTVLFTGALTGDRNFTDP